jgi:hypothetical protein
MAGGLVVGGAFDCGEARQLPAVKSFELPSGFAFVIRNKTQTALWHESDFNFHR